MKFRITSLFFALGSTAAMAAVTVGTDSADSAAYGSGFTNGSDGGTAGTFGAWSFSNSPTNSGNLIGDSTQLNGDINTGGVSFGMFANGAGFANANRDFNTNELAVGQTFSVSLAVNFRNGNKGFSLFDGGTEIFNFNIGGDNYVVNNAATGNGSTTSGLPDNGYNSNSVFDLSFSQTTGTGGTWSITRSGGLSDLDTGTFAGVADNFRLYIASTDGGTPNNDLYFNNLSVVPEPSALLLGAVGSLILLRRRK